MPYFIVYFNYFSKKKGFDDLEFKRADWEKIASMIKILEPVYKSTKMVEKHETSAGFIVPLLHLLKHELIDLFTSNEYEDVRHAIYDGVNKRLGNWKSNKYLMFSMILEPKFRLDLMPLEERSIYREQLVNEIMVMLRTVDTVTEDGISSMLPEEEDPFASILSHSSHSQQIDNEDPFDSILPNSSKNAVMSNPMKQAVEKVI